MSINTCLFTLALFLYVPFNAPHSPFQAPKEYIDRNTEVESGLGRTFSGMITCMDEAIGKIVAAADEHLPADETLIFFCSDNGALPNVGSNGILRGRKGSFYEGGVRVAALMVWQGKLKRMRVLSKVPVFFR